MCKVDSGRLLGLVSRAVFKTVERLLELLVCSIRTAFRQQSLHARGGRYWFIFLLPRNSKYTTAPISTIAKPGHVVAGR